MIRLTTHLNSTPVCVNPAAIHYVVESKQGCVIVFGKDDSLHVANNYSEVISLLSSR